LTQAGAQLIYLEKRVVPAEMEEMWGTVSVEAEAEAEPVAMEDNLSFDLAVLSLFLFS
jgi:hypothetical protein